MTDNPPYRFVFDFTHESHPAGGDEVFVYMFPFVSNHEKAEQLRDEEDEFVCQSEEMEEYGIHDFATTGNYELVGFHSYEVEPQYWLTVVQKWHKWFTEQGVGCGDIEEMTRDEYERRYF